MRQTFRRTVTLATVMWRMSTGGGTCSSTPIASAERAGIVDRAGRSLSDALRR